MIELLAGRLDPREENDSKPHGIYRLSLLDGNMVWMLTSKPRGAYCDIYVKRHYDELRQYYLKCGKCIKYFPFEEGDLDGES